MLTVAFKNPNDYKLVTKGVNLENKRIKAVSAVTRTTYYCPYCGCRIYKKTSSNAIDFFARYRKEIHTNEVCKQIEKNNKKLYATDIPEFSVEDLFAHIFVEPKITSTAPKHPGWGTPDDPPDDFGVGSEDDSSNDEIDPEEEESFIEEDEDNEVLSDEPLIIRKSPVTDISHLIDDLLYDRCGPNHLINNSKCIKLSDILLATPSFDCVFETPDILNGCRKILELQPDYSFSGNKILCHIFNYKREKIYFYLTFEDKKEFNKACKKMFKKGTWENGTPRDERKFSSVFVASVWKKDPHGYFDKKNQTTVPLFVGEIINAGTQICTSTRYRVK